MLESHWHDFLLFESLIVQYVDILRFWIFILKTIQNQKQAKQMSHCGIWMQVLVYVWKFAIIVETIETAWEDRNENLDRHSAMECTLSYNYLKGFGSIRMTVIRLQDELGIKQTCECLHKRYSLFGSFGSKNLKLLMRKFTTLVWAKRILIFDITCRFSFRISRLLQKNGPKRRRRVDMSQLNTKLTSKYSKDAAQVLNQARFVWNL